MNREERIKRMFYGWDEEKDIIREIQKCQRNWDLTKPPIHQELIDYLLWTAQNSPSKQHEGYYDLYWSADRKVLDELSKYTWGTTHPRNPPANWRNSQMNANLYILWVAKEPDTQLNCNANGTLKPNDDLNRWHNAYVSIGISIGLTMRAAAKLGFATGCNKSHNDMNGDDFWLKRLGILEDDMKNPPTKRITYGLGIGYPQKDRPRWESDDTELMIGAANGSKITTTGQEKHPRSGKKMRKAKIVDIKKDAGKFIEDPYGNIHQIPDKAEIKINTIRKRNIKIIEIK